jgi:hypothetical protein
MGKKKKEDKKAFYFPTWFSTTPADGTMRINSTPYVKHVKRPATSSHCRCMAYIKTLAHVICGQF